MHNLLHYVGFNYLSCMLFLLLVGVILDAFLASIVFMVTGNFILVSEVGFDFYNQRFLLLSQENFRIHTELKGLDLLINSFIEYQYSMEGRWKMLSWITIMAIPFMYLADETYDSKFTDVDDVWAAFFFILGLFTILPFLLSIFFGLASSI